MNNIEQLIEGTDYKKFKENLKSTTPELDNIFKRWAQFESASPLIQDILLQLYPNKFTLVSTAPATVHPLEIYIYALDQVIEDGQMVRALGSAIGIYIEVSVFEEAYEIFIDKLIAHIDFLKSGAEVRNESHFAESEGLDVRSFSFPKALPTTAKLMFYTRPEFFDLLKKFDMLPKDNEFAELLYQDRLAVLREIYQTKLKS